MENKQKIEEVGNWYDKNEKLYRRFSEAVSEIIEKVLDKKKIPYQSITFRVKEKESYIKKCQKEKYTNPIDEIMDLSGIRIIAYTNHDVEKICRIVKEQFEIDDDNSVNKADLLEENQVGYLSVHYIAQLNQKRIEWPEYEDFKGLRCEIQIRTLLQHAWAEIEHDKNYKFSGVLPNEIKRRFYLVAGVLEMMDREFDDLSKEIDKYAEDIKEKTQEGNLDFEINSTTLCQYLTSKFKNNSMVEPNPGRQYRVGNGVIAELKRFGFKKVKDIDECLDKEMMRKVTIYKNTCTGLLRDMMIFIDIEKYFEEAYDGAWVTLEPCEIEVYEENGISDFRDYMERYGIKEVEEES